MFGKQTLRTIYSLGEVDDDDDDAKGLSLNQLLQVMGQTPN